MHNLKSPTAFSFAWEHMQAATKPYDHAHCMSQVKNGGRPVAEKLLRKEYEANAAKRRMRKGRKRGGKKKAAAA